MEKKSVFRRMVSNVVFFFLFLSCSPSTPTDFESLSGADRTPDSANFRGESKSVSGVRRQNENFPRKASSSGDENDLPIKSWTERFVLNHSSHPTPGAPTVVVHAPNGFNPDLKLQIVVFLHGWSGCATVLEGTGQISCFPNKQKAKRYRGWALGDHHDEGGTNSLLVIPQLSFLQRSSDPGRFSEDGFFQSFLSELLGRRLTSRLGEPKKIADVDRVVLIAHSAGYKTALSIAQKGGIDQKISDIILMDALYASPLSFADWVIDEKNRSQRKIVSIHTGKGRTFRFSQMLYRRLVKLLGTKQVVLEPASSLATAIHKHRGVIYRTTAPHGEVPARHFAEVLRGLGLRQRLSSE